MPVRLSRPPPRPLPPAPAPDEVNSELHAVLTRFGTVVAEDVGTVGDEFFTYQVPAGQGGTYAVGVRYPGTGVGNYVLTWDVATPP